MPDATPLLILASASPRRRDLLRQIGIEPDATVAAEVDESLRKGELPRPHALRLARAKAEAVRRRIEGTGPSGPALILAADTVVSAGRRILPKAETPEQVGACLELLSGRRHRVTTALALIDPAGKLRERAVETVVAFRRLTDAEVAAYVRTGEGLGKAGGYAVQGRAGAFVKALNGSYTNVVGLPLTECLLLLRGCGYVPAC